MKAASVTKITRKSVRSTRSTRSKIAATSTTITASETVRTLRSRSKSVETTSTESTASKASTSTTKLITDSGNEITIENTDIQVSSSNQTDINNDQYLQDKIKELGIQFLSDGVTPRLKYFDNIVKTSKDNHDLKLPDKFYEYHNKDFINGLNFIISKDPSLYDTIVKNTYKIAPKEIKDIEYLTSGNFYFHKLIDGIISQQISGKAAVSIKNKIIDNISSGLNKEKRRLPNPIEFIESTIEELRSFGLSYKKAEYCQRLSLAFENTKYLETIPEEGVKFSYDYFNNMKKDNNQLQLRTDLEKFKGIGPWSSSMFAMFALEDMNIFEKSDLGIKRGTTKYINDRPELLNEINELIDLKLIKKKTKRVTKSSSSSSSATSSKKIKVYYDDNIMDVVSEQFSPYKTIFNLIIWRISDMVMDALDN
ncbi:alkylbase DNA N-glycosylase activity protein [[Candida] boidinii]|nr:alkylbase DNA N-glycosylase activity protein [[Candida] boidinii]